MPKGLLIICLLFSVQTFIVAANDSLFLSRPKIMIGAKVILEKSGPRSLFPWTYPVYSGGLQILRPLKFWLLQFETGLYLNSKAISNYEDQNKLGVKNFYSFFRYISIPINCRLNTKYFYISVGPFADYLLKIDNNGSNYGIRDMNRMEFGLNASTGLHWTFKKKITAFVEGRISQTYVSPPDHFLKDLNFRNIGIGIGMNYTIEQKGAANR